MHEKSPRPGRRGVPTRQTPAHRTWALARLIILSHAAEVESTVRAKKDVTLVMSWKKNNKKPETLRAGEERGELGNK